jgi:hypothetical protein
MKLDKHINFRFDISSTIVSNYCSDSVFNYIFFEISNFIYRNIDISNLIYGKLR